MLNRRRTVITPWGILASVIEVAERQKQQQLIDNH